jgi:hypothetical protein
MVWRMLAAPAEMLSGATAYNQPLEWDLSEWAANGWNDTAQSHTDTDNHDYQTMDMFKNTVSLGECNKKRTHLAFSDSGTGIMGSLWYYGSTGGGGNNDWSTLCDHLPPPVAPPGPAPASPAIAAPPLTAPAIAAPTIAAPTGSAVGRALRVRARHQLLARGRARMVTLFGGGWLATGDRAWWWHP